MTGDQVTGDQVTGDRVTGDQETRATDAGASPATDGEPVVESPETLAEEPENPESFGRWLRRQRELRGVELRAIAESSKISLAYLRALEEGRFDLLPAEIFAKGFVDQYARFVGLDPEEAVNFYLVAKAQSDEEQEALYDLAEPPPQPSGARWVVVALVLAALSLGLIWFLSRAGSEDSAGDSPAAGADTVAADTVAADTVAADTAIADADAAAAEDAEAGAGGPGTAADPAAGASTDPSATNDAAGEPPAVVSRSPLRVVVDFTDSCWVSAREDGGETLQKLFTQGESLILEAQSAVQLKVGNHRSAVVEVNGMPYDLAAAGRGSSLVRDVRIDLETVERLRQGA